MSKELPPCGLYRTTAAFSGVEAGRLVYFHNHGDPGPGVYYPEKWHQNTAQFSQRGTTCPPEFDANASLKALPIEGFYRVLNEFHCCEKQCTKFERDVFVQLGYNGSGAPILFMPELTNAGIKIPEKGTIIDEGNLAKIELLRVAQKDGATKSDAGSSGGGGGKPEIKFPRGGFSVH